MQYILDTIQKKPKTSGKGIRVLVNAASRDALTISHKQGFREKPTKEDKRQLETIGKTLEATIVHIFSDATKDKNISLNPQSETVKDILDIAQNDVSEIIKDFKELISFQESPVVNNEASGRNNFLKMDLLKLDTLYKDYLDTKSVLPHNTSPKNVSLKTLRFISEKIFQMLSNNKINVTYNNVENVHIAMLKGEINIAVSSEDNKNGYKYIPFDLEKYVDLIPLSHKEVMDLQKKNKDDKKPVVLLTHLPILSRHKRSQSFDSLPSLDLTEVSKSTGILSDKKSNDSTTETPKKDTFLQKQYKQITQSIMNSQAVQSIASEGLNYATDTFSDAAINHVTEQPQTLLVKMTVTSFNIMNDTFMTLKDIPNLTPKDFDDADMGVLDMNNIPNDTHTQTGIVGAVAEYFVKNKLKKNKLPQDIIDKRVNIVRTLPAALSEYSQTQTITPNAKGEYTAGQEMVLLAIKSQDRLITKIKESQIDSKMGQALDVVGVNNADIKTVQKITEALIKETMELLPDNIYKKSLLTLVQKSLNFGIVKDISVRTKLCDNASVKLQDNILHIAVMDTTSKKGYKYIPVNDLNEDIMFPLSNQDINDFGLINDMQPILKVSLNEVHNDYPISRIREPKTKKEIKKAKIRDAQIQEQKQKRYDNYMENIHHKIVSHQDTPQNMTYLQYFSKVSSDAGQILTGNNPETNSKTA